MSEAQLRILILEDVATDAELAERELRQANLDFTARRVATKEEFVTSLEDFAPDIILADYSLPGFDGLSALSLAQQQCADVPFVFVSGALGDERAIATLKKGATDYVLKQRLSALAPAVQRALGEAQERIQRQRAEESLRRSEAKHRVLLQVNNAVIAQLDRTSLFDAITAALRELLTFDRSTLALYDPVADVLRVVAIDEATESSDLPGKGLEVPRAESHLGWVFDSKQHLLRSDLETGLRFPIERELLNSGIRSYVSVPLIGKERALGTLNIASHDPDRYSEDDALFLGEVANQISLAIENMLAYEEIARLKRRVENENVYLKEEIQTHHNFDEIIDTSPAITKVLKAIETVAPTLATVLISGETGTGKELLARAVHHLSEKKDRPLVTVNCAALPANLIESELFGHERGAFTGAVTRKIGRFELANGGAVFLDEIGDLPLELQAKLLRVLQEGEFQRVGGTHTFKVDVRIIAATNRDLEEAIAAEKFRSDLYYRLNVFPIHVPPLRKRRDDIPHLVRHFIQKYAKRLGRPVESIPARTLDALLSYSWPGNVRELENVIERAVILTQGRTLKLGEWPPRTPGTKNGSAIPTLDELQRNHIVEVLELTGWRVSGDRGAAKLLGIKPTTLEARMKKLGIQRAQ